MPSSISSPHSGQFQTAEQHFKNIQVLKNIRRPVNSSIIIAASLGVECEFCHVEHANDKTTRKQSWRAQDDHHDDGHQSG
jgi:hypothetical protein